MYFRSSVDRTTFAARAAKWAPRLFIGALAALAVFLLAYGRPAESHAVLERSAPSANQNLDTSPAAIELWFTEPPDHALTTVRLLDASGAEITLGKVQGGQDPLYASVTVGRTLLPGVYTVVYDNLSKADGHRWQGFFPFVVLNPDGSQPAATPLPSELVEQGRSGQLPNGLDVVLKWVSLLAAVVIVGGSIAHLAVVRPASSSLPEEESEEINALSDQVLFVWTRLGALVLFIGATGQALLLVDRLGGFSRLADVLVDTRPGVLWLIRISLAVAIGAVGLAAPRSLSRLPSWVLPASLTAMCLGLIAAYSMASHAAASATGGEASAVASDFIHFAATGLWLGVLAHLALFWRQASRSDLDDGERLILTANLFDRFSAVAVISVFLLLLTGVFSAFVQIPEWNALWETTYGQVLLLKLALVLPLLAVAGINALYLKPALVNAIDAQYADDDEGTAPKERPVQQIDSLRSRLAKTIRLELGLGVLVIASVAILTQTGTSRGELAQEQAQERAALAAAPREHETFVFNANKLAGDLAVAFRVDPQLVGINRLQVSLSSAEGKEIGEVEEVSLRFFYFDPAFGSTNNIAAQFDSASPTGELIYKLEGAYFSIGGGYRVQVDIKRTGMDDARAIFPLQVEDTPEAKRDALDFPFYIGNQATTGAIILLVLSVGVVFARSQISLFGSWLKPASELLALGLFAGSAVLSVGAVVSPSEEAGRNPVPLTAESVERGRILYARNCSVCHGDTGRGDGPAGVNLRPQPADFLVHVPYHGDTSLYGWISNGVQGTGMPAWGDQLTEQERWDLVNFLRKNFGDELVNQKIIDASATPTSIPTTPQP